MIKIDDWDLIQYFDDRGVDYRLSGKNISKGSIGINCPNCGDKNYHLNINIEKKIYHCWRCNNNGNAIKLISFIDGVSLHKAHGILESLVGRVIQYDTENNITSIVSGVFNSPKNPKVAVDKVELPPDIEPLEFKPYKIYSKYLVKRGFAPSTFTTWGAYYCRNDLEYGGRIIFPIYLNKKIVSFQGRTVYNNKIPRYKACASDKSIVNIKDTLYLYDEFNKGDVVVLVEGIFDALRVRSFGLSALAVFNMQLTDGQLELLMSKPPGLAVIMLDRGEYIMSRRMWHDLENVGIASETVSISEYKDPGSCDDKEHLLGLVEKVRG